MRKGGRRLEWREEFSFCDQFSADTSSFDRVVCLNQSELLDSAIAIEVRSCLTCN